MKYTCQYDSRCGGCDMLAFDYEKQLAKKKQYLSRLLAPYGRVGDVLGMSKPLHYRNKVHAVFTSDRKGNISSGIYEAGTHNVIPVKNCLIENETAQAIIATVTDLIKSFRLTVYDEDRKTGLFRHILVRTAHVTGQVMVTLVLSSTMFPSKNNFIKALREAHPEITTIVMNINNRRTSMVLGDREDVIFGRGYIEDELCGCRFCISSKSFYQVNSAQTEILYNKAMEFANLKDGDTVIDAYCGIGTIGITAAMNARKAGRSCRITGVELNASAVKDAIGLKQTRQHPFHLRRRGRFYDGACRPPRTRRRRIHGSAAYRQRHTFLKLPHPPCTEPHRLYLVRPRYACPRPEVPDAQGICCGTHDRGRPVPDDETLRGSVRAVKEIKSEVKKETDI